MKKILAVSGGVDSVVMLDLLLKKWGVCGKGLSHDANNRDGKYSVGDIIVAHFDHAMRENSQDDADFVRRLAEEKGLKFVTKRAKKGEIGSEAAAREARYEFLRELAGMDGEIYVAHHLDDLVETVMINLVRGTGWRGLAGMSQGGVNRPLLESEIIFEPMDKRAVFEYAAKCGLYYREDPTNSSDEYLRNRIRHGTNLLDYEMKLKIYELWQRQQRTREEIDQIVAKMLPGEEREWKRKWFFDLAKRMEDEECEAGREAWRLVAIELLRAGTLRAGVSATRPQLEEFRRAILDYKPGKKFNLPGDKLITILKNSFIL